MRIDKICKIIKECRHGIHDISREEPDATSGLPRFNMPFELGLFLGCERHGNRAQRAKSCIVFDSAPYRYQQSMSDIAGQDILARGGDIEELPAIRKSLRLDEPTLTFTDLVFVIKEASR